MGFVLGSEDFRQIREDRRLRHEETKRINAYKRARLDEQQPSTAPVMPTGQRTGLVVNQVGPTAAETAFERGDFVDAGATDRGNIADPRPDYAGLTSPPSRVDPGSGAGAGAGLHGGPGRPYLPHGNPWLAYEQMFLRRPGEGYFPDPVDAGATDRGDTRDPRDRGLALPVAPLPAPLPAPPSGRQSLYDRWTARRERRVELDKTIEEQLLKEFGTEPAKGANQTTADYGASLRKYYASWRKRRYELEYEFGYNELQTPDAVPAAAAAAAAVNAPSPFSVDALKRNALELAVWGIPGVAKKIATSLAGVATATAPSAAPVLSAADRAIKHDAIKYLESTNGTNIPKWTKKRTSSGVYGATDGTATKHGIPGVYAAQLKGLTPGSSGFNAEKDKAAASLFDHYLGLYPTDPARVAVSYRFGTTAGKNWNGSDAGIRALAKRVKNVDPDEAVRYVQTYVQEQLSVADPFNNIIKGLLAPAPAAPTAAPVSAAVAAPVTVADGTPTQVAVTATADIQNNRANPLPPIDRPVVPLNGGRSMNKQLATRKPEDIKEPPFNMPFNLRAQEINTLLQAREGLKRQAYITGADPASAAYIEARAALGMNKAAIENMTQTQALNMMQINNDPRMMNELLNTQFPGRGIRISPNSDGTFRVEADGKIIGARVNKKELISGMRRTNSVQLHAALKAAKAKAITARDKAMWKLQEMILGKRWDHFTKLQQEQMKLRGVVDVGEDGQLWSHNARGERVTLGMADRKSPDREGTTVVPTETPVEEINPEGLVSIKGVTPALAGHFGAFRDPI